MMMYVTVLFGSLYLSIFIFCLSQTVQLFSYLNDKDMFAEIYRNQVRLLHLAYLVVLPCPGMT